MILEIVLVSSRRCFIEGFECRLDLDIVITANGTHSEDDYPTIIADVNALEGPSQKDISVKGSAANTPKQFGCQSYCQNQGVCTIVAQSVNCQCLNGYTGVQCQVARKSQKRRIELIVSIDFFFNSEEFLISTRQGCNPNPCDNGGTCEEVYPNTISCTCPPGFVGSLCSYPGKREYHHRIE